MVGVPALAHNRGALRAHVEKLASEVDVIKRSTSFQAALDAMALFWRYSVMNQWLIFRSCPHASRVASRAAWKKLGRTPRADVEPIEILAPTKQGFPFISVHVFDVSQTEGAAIPVLDLNLDGESAPVELLECASHKLGVRITELPVRHTLGDVAIGRSIGGEIQIVAGLTRDERAAVIAHELAHELLHHTGSRKRDRRLTTAEVETEAEATAHVVLRVLGSPSKGATYIAWCGLDGAAILRSMIRIQRATRAILDAATRAPTGLKPSRSCGPGHGCVGGG